MNINELIERLKRAEQKYSAFAFVFYCVECDGIAVNTCYKNHTVLFKRGVENDEIWASIKILEYIRKNLIEFIRFSSSLEKN